MRLLIVTLVIGLSASFATASERVRDFRDRAQHIVQDAGGEVGFAVLHIESGEMVAVHGRAPMALFSVFKVPVAIVVLREVEAGRLRLDQTVRVLPSEASGGVASNVARWIRPVDTTIRELIRLSIVYSDNTSVDKLLHIVGGPAVVSRAISALGFPGIKIRAFVRSRGRAKRRLPNVATAEDLVRLLAALRKNELLPPERTDLLRGFMRDAVTGMDRIRGRLPEGTAVEDKTGTGSNSTNDIGIITLPGDRGHLAIAVLISGSKRPPAAQEKTIADLARAAYDAYRIEVPAPLQAAPAEIAATPTRP